MRRPPDPKSRARHLAAALLRHAESADRLGSHDEAESYRAAAQRIAYEAGNPLGWVPDDSNDVILSEAVPPLVRYSYGMPGRVPRPHVLLGLAYTSAASRDATLSISRTRRDMTINWANSHAMATALAIKLGEGIDRLERVSRAATALAAQESKRETGHGLPAYWRASWQMGFAGAMHAHLWRAVPSEAIEVGDGSGEPSTALTELLWGDKHIEPNAEPEAGYEPDKLVERARTLGWSAYEESYDHEEGE